MSTIARNVGSSTTLVIIGIIIFSTCASLDNHYSNHGGHFNPTPYYIARSFFWIGIVIFVIGLINLTIVSITRRNELRGMIISRGGPPSQPTNVITVIPQTAGDVQRTHSPQYPGQQPYAPQEPYPSQNHYPDKSYPGQTNVQQPYPTQNYPGQTNVQQPYPTQNYPGQTNVQQPYPTQNYPGQTNVQQPYPTQNYPGQTNVQQPYPTQNYPGQPYPPQQSFHQLPAVPPAYDQIITETKR